MLGDIGFLFSLGFAVVVIIIAGILLEKLK